MKRLVLVSALLLTVLLGVQGCIFNPDRDSGEPEDLLKTPEGVVEQIQRAYLRKDIDLYLEAMVDTAVWHFRPSDVDVAYPAPTWGKTEEEFYHRNMFTRAHHIELALVGNVADKEADDPETWRLFREYDLIVWLTEETICEPGPGYGWTEFVVQKGEDERFRVVDWYDLENPP